MHPKLAPLQKHLTDDYRQVLTRNGFALCA